jgi:thiamine pyrophosphokinase
VIGDFDSLTPTELEDLQAHGTRLIRYPSRKDFTDLELALQYACEQNADQVIVFGALGLRWDQTLANILLLANPSTSRPRIGLLDGSQEILLIRESQTIEIFGQPGDTVSLIPINGNAEGISTIGLEYPLMKETLQFGATRGVSNVLLENQATIHLEQGLLICIVIHQEVEK